ncbi:MAG TPA: DNA repair protein RadC [Bacteroidales bacterium]|jgi:DNA repair protein RadC|nr:DNA repair protein RadC [Bacteroidales bacterium]HOS15661.1 DNA repair protein RadC [Bacteroidales bacterium]
MKTSISKWAETDRPREKMIAKGPMALSEAELIAILISSGNREESAVDLAKRILADCNNNLTELSAMELQDLMNYNGIGEAKAVCITAALELGRRRRESEAILHKKITSSKNAYDYIYPNIAELSHEEFWIILLKTNKQIIGKKLIGVGGLNSTVADPKKIFHHIVSEKAAGFILCHNHPSGNLQPSDTDIKLTKEIQTVSKLLHVDLVDHIIACPNAYFSFVDDNLL